MPELILASASPRRKTLLQQIGIKPDLIKPSHIDESILKDEKPMAYARRIAVAKAEEIAKEHGGAFVLGADTVVACGNRILPKAENDAEVTKFLGLLSGRQHTVISAICLISPQGKKSVKDVITKVKFKNLSKKEIDRYLKSGEGLGKAGGYAIQGLAGCFVRHINGSYSSVVGLPLYEVKNMLTGMGYE